MSKNTSPFELLLGSDTRFKIWVLLSLYSEMNLGELARLLNKSKSTIHEHLQKLLDTDLIEEVREEYSQGRIPAKYYGLNPNYQELLRTSPEMDHVSDRLDVQKAFKFIQTQKVVLETNMNIYRMKSRFLHHIENQLLSDSPELQQSVVDLLDEMRPLIIDGDNEEFRSEFLEYFEFFSEDQFHRFKDEFLSLAYKYEQEKKALLESGSSDPQLFYFFATGIPLKRLLEFNQQF